MITNLKVWSYLSKEKNPLETTDNSEVDDSPAISRSGESKNSNLTEKANEWGSYLLEVGKTATSKAAKQLRENVSTSSLMNNLIEHGNIISNFSNEQMRFKSEKRNFEKKREEVCLPWINALNNQCDSSDSIIANEQNLKLKILSVSSDERNFLRNPPIGSNFEFNCSLFSPVASLLLCEDPNLAKMRFKLVPKMIKEEIFWRNYFYRISLIKQSLQSNTEDKDRDEVLIEHHNIETGMDSQDQEPEQNLDDSSGNKVMITEVKMKELKSAAKSVTSASKKIAQAQSSENNDDWEAELQKELSEFELISGENGPDIMDLVEKADFDDLEKEIMNELEK